MNKLGSDDIHKKRKRARKARKEATKDVAPYRFLIVCEGAKTEPNYFKPLKDQLEKTFREIVDLKALDFKNFIEIDGSGKNTESLVDHTLKLRREASIPYGHVWCVFDKDSFKSSQFNGAIENAEQNDIQVAWSNEAIELWFLLHFEFLNTGINRGQYIQKLNDYFKAYNIGNGKYEKNQENIYEILKVYGNQSFAIENAKKLLREGKSYADMKPATTVFQLIELLESYL